MVIHLRKCRVVVPFGKSVENVNEVSQTNASLFVWISILVVIKAKQNKPKNNVTKKNQTNKQTTKQNKTKTKNKTKQNKTITEK